MIVRYRIRLYILVLVFLAGFGGLLAKLWSLQIDSYEKYRNLLPGSKQVTVRVPGVRGAIKDRNGVTLVTNEANFEVLFDLKMIVEDYRDTHGTLPKVTKTVWLKGIQRPREVVDIVKVVNDSIVPQLEKLGLAGSYSLGDLESHYISTQGIVRWPYRDDLSFSEFATFAEHNLELPGVEVNVRPKRRYVYGSLASHVLGYVSSQRSGDVSEEEREKFDYYVGDEIGVAGIERSQDHYLKARHGKKIILKDEKSRFVGEIGYEPPGAGNDVYLTLDARIQYIVERALQDANLGRAAAVVLQPSSGDILAMASYPSYDPNEFIPSITPKNWAKYRSDPTTPLINRAVKDYPPGSTFKIPVALAGCFAGIGDRHLNCDGGQLFGNKFMKCWIYSKGGRHNGLDLDEALMRSCNDYFYNYGIETGIDNIKQVATMLGLGNKTGVPLDGEDPGIVPDPEWWRIARGGSWTRAQTALVSIGQGVAEASPLQMASVAATVGNGGVKHSPWLISKVVEPDGLSVVPARPKSLDLVKEGFRAEQIELVRKGMWRVINDIAGTAKKAKSTGFDTAGKTGTAQDFRWNDEIKEQVKDNRAWFVAFAPYEQPEVAVCVMVGNGKSGGGVAAPIAARIIEESMALGKGFDAELQALIPATGNFFAVEAVDYEQNLAAAFLEPDEGETGEEVDVEPSRGSGQVGAGTTAAPEPAVPNVREEADEVKKPAIIPPVKFKRADPDRNPLKRRGPRR